MHSAASILWIESEWSDGSVCIDFPGPNRCNYFHFPPLICLFPGSRLFERGFDFLFFHLLICLFVNFFIATASGTFEPFLCPFLPPTLLNFLHVFCVGIFPLITGFVGSLRTLSRWCACCFTHRFFLWDVPDALRFFYYSFFFYHWLTCWKMPEDPVGISRSHNIPLRIFDESRLILEYVRGKRPVTNMNQSQRNGRRRSRTAPPPPPQKKNHKYWWMLIDLLLFGKPKNDPGGCGLNTRVVSRSFELLLLVLLACRLWLVVECRRFT